MRGDLAKTPPVGAKALLSQVDDAIARLRIAARVGDLTHEEDMAVSDAETAIRRELTWLARERHLLVVDERDTSWADSEISSLIGILERLYDNSATLHRSAVRSDPPEQEGHFQSTSLRSTASSASSPIHSPAMPPTGNLSSIS